MDPIVSFIPVISALIGGLLTYLGIYATQRLTRTREQKQYYRVKLERAYMLAQSLYDGHKTEIDKLKASEKLQAAEWLQNRKHPGEVMSEIKMIAGMYVPALQSALDDVNKHHQVLKSTFLKIDEEMRSGASTWTSRSQTAREMNIELEHLGYRLNDLKRKLADQVKKL